MTTERFGRAPAATKLRATSSRMRAAGRVVVGAVVDPVAFALGLDARCDRGARSGRLRSTSAPASLPSSCRRRSRSCASSYFDVTVRVTRDSRGRAASISPLPAASFRVLDRRWRAGKELPGARLADVANRVRRGSDHHRRAVGQQRRDCRLPARSPSAGPTGTASDRPAGT